jgi:hypothetical protein
VHTFVSFNQTIFTPLSGRFCQDISAIQSKILSAAIMFYVGNNARGFYKIVNIWGQKTPIGQ